MHHHTAGELLTETLDYDGGRQVTVYVPTATPRAVVYAADGRLIAQWGRLLEATDLPATMIVGIHGHSAETPRLHEYSPAFDIERFTAHERFFALGLRHPHLYGAVVSGSPGAGHPPPDVMPAALPRVYLFAGTREPFFLDNATTWAAALRKAGADVEMNTLAVPHGAAAWRAQFPLMLAWALGHHAPT